ncbi:hypothetical protein EIP91_002441 [Steccherinum ochraceum]|uniref:Uncharacterized protein n=1 Tax=Steccherinum ochraceum TaxID=92696 RepID=A0A4R0RSW8_9APHY|nr:hypothetical protein EIP91_002441 [Steccherinum ochraceum]
MPSSRATHLNTIGSGRSRSFLDDYFDNLPDVLAPLLETLSITGTARSEAMLRFFGPRAPNVRNLMLGNVELDVMLAGSVSDFTAITNLDIIVDSEPEGIESVPLCNNHIENPSRSIPPANRPSENRDPGPAAPSSDGPGPGSSLAKSSLAMYLFETASQLAKLDGLATLCVLEEEGVEFGEDGAWGGKRLCWGEKSRHGRMSVGYGSSLLHRSKYTPNTI